FPDGAASIQTLSGPTPRTNNYVQLPNTAPFLAAVTNRTIFEGQVLVFTASAGDTDSPPQHLTFTVDPGAPTGASINPDTGLFSWRPDPAQAPSINPITLRVTDDATPPLSSTTTFT